MMKKLLNILKYILLFALSVFLMWYALRNQDFSRVIEQLRNANYIWLVLSILVSIAGFVSRAHRWNMQLEPTGYRPRLIDTYNAMMVGYLANLVLPRAGEVVRCTMLKKTEDVPVKVSVGTVITERVIDLVMLLSLLAATFFIEFDRLHTYFTSLLTDRYQSLEQNSSLIYWGGGGFLVVSVISLVLIFLNLNKLRQNLYFAKLFLFLKGVLEGIFSIMKMKRKGEFLFHTAFVWVTYYLMSYLVFFSFPETSNLGPGAALSLLVIGGLGMAAPVQGGIGIFHIMVQATLVLYGLSKEAGMAYALVVHTSQTLLVVLMGGISFIMSMIKARKTAQQDAAAVQVVHEFK